MPSSSATEFGTLQQHDIGLTKLCQMVRGRAADDAATNDDDFGLPWEICGHFVMASGFTVAKNCHDGTYVPEGGQYGTDGTR
jgi:hypothetical protein